MTNWPEFSDDVMQHLPLVSRNGKSMSVLNPSCRSIADGWRKSIESLLAIRELEDDWDGRGTPTPTTDVVDAATILAVNLRRRGVRAPSATLQGVAGDVFFEWQWPDRTTLTLEVEGPCEARLIRATADGTAAEIPLFDAVTV